MKKSLPERNNPRRVDPVLDVEPPDRVPYEEYVSGFDEVPVLDDVVAMPPRRALPPSFVHGERRSLRREERADGYALREAGAAEMERYYEEYAARAPARAKRKKRGKPATGKRGSPRKRKVAAG